jgi:HlyD family secretion protein
MTRKMKGILWSGLGLSLLLGGGWYGFLRGRDEEVFTVEAAKVQDLRDKVEANGQIQPLTRVNVGSQVTGVIQEIHVKDGQMVRAGDLLVTLDQVRYRQDVATAELGLRGSQQDLQNAEATFRKLSQSHQRQERLFKEGFLSSEDYQTTKLSMDTAGTSLQKARVTVHQAEASLAIAEDALSKTLIRASMAGTVTGLKAERGEMAIAGATNLAGAVMMVISDLSVVLAEIAVGELDVVKLKLGQPAEIQVDALPGRVFQGRVLEVASSIDAPGSGGNGMPQNQNYRVRVRLEGAPGDLAGFRPGMSARVAILSSEVAHALTVPLQAIQERETRTGALKLMSGSRTVVFVAKGGRVVERDLRTGVLTRRAAEVLGGVQEGELVVTGPAKAMAGLATGAAVRTQTEAEAIRKRKS